MIAVSTADQTEDPFSDYLHDLRKTFFFLPADIADWRRGMLNMIVLSIADQTADPFSDYLHNLRENQFFIITDNERDLKAR